MKSFHSLMNENKTLNLYKRNSQGGYTASDNEKACDCEEEHPGVSHKKWVAAASKDDDVNEKRYEIDEDEGTAETRRRLARTQTKAAAKRRYANSITIRGKQARADQEAGHAHNMEIQRQAKERDAKKEEYDVDEALDPKTRSSAGIRAQFDRQGKIYDDPQAHHIKKIKHSLSKGRKEIARQRLNDLELRNIRGKIKPPSKSQTKTVAGLRKKVGEEVDYLDEISLKTKVDAYRKMRHQARKQHDPQGREGFSYDDSKKREKGVATTKDPATKTLHRRAHTFLGKIEKGHGSKASGQAKGGAAKDAKNYPYDKHGKDPSTSVSAQVDRLYTRSPAKIMKGGPRKGKMSKDAIETSKRIARQRVGEEYEMMDEGRPWGKKIGAEWDEPKTSAADRAHNQQLAARLAAKKAARAKSKTAGERYRADLSKTAPAGQPYSKTDAAYKARKSDTNKKKIDEARMGEILKNVKKGTEPYTIVAIKAGRVVDQEHTKMAQAVPAFVREMQKKHPDAKISVEDRRGRVLHSEDYIDEAVSVDGRTKGYRDAISRIAARHKVVADRMPAPEPDENDSNNNTDNDVDNIDEFIAPPENVGPKQRQKVSMNRASERRRRQGKVASRSAHTGSGAATAARIKRAKDFAKRLEIQRRRRQDMAAQRSRTVEDVGGDVEDVDKEANKNTPIDKRTGAQKILDKHRERRRRAAEYDKEHPVEEAKNQYADGSTVKVVHPQRGKGVVKGKVVRHDKGHSGGSPFYVVAIPGVAQSVKVSDHNMIKENSEEFIDEARRMGDGRPVPGKNDPITRAEISLSKKYWEKSAPLRQGNISDYLKGKGRKKNEEFEMMVDEGGLGGRTQSKIEKTGTHSSNLNYITKSKKQGWSDRGRSSAPEKKRASKESRRAGKKETEVDEEIKVKMVKTIPPRKSTVKRDKYLSLTKAQKIALARKKKTEVDEEYVIEYTDNNEVFLKKISEAKRPTAPSKESKKEKFNTSPVTPEDMNYLSDFHKEVHGVRPRGMYKHIKTVGDYHNQIDSLSKTAKDQQKQIKQDRVNRKKEKATEKKIQKKRTFGPKGKTQKSTLTPAFQKAYAKSQNKRR